MLSLSSNESCDPGVGENNATSRPKTVAPSPPPAAAFLQGAAANARRVMMGYGPVIDENQQQIRIQQAVDRYNGILPPYCRSSAAYKASQVMKLKGFKPPVPQSQSTDNAENLRQNPETRYMGAGPGHLPNVILSKPIIRPFKKQTILSKLSLDGASLPISRLVDDSYEKYSDLKSARSVLDVLHDLSRKRIHGKDEGDESPKRRCMGLGGDLVVNDAEIPYRPLFVSKAKQVISRKDETTQTCSRSQTPIVSQQQDIARDEKSEIRRRLALKNNEITASLSSSVDLPSMFSKRKRVADLVKPSEDSESKKQKTQEEVLLIEKTALPPRTPVAPRSPPTGDKLMRIYWEMPSPSETKKAALEYLKKNPGESQFKNDNSPKDSPDISSKPVESLQTSVTSSVSFSFSSESPPSYTFAPAIVPKSVLKKPVERQPESSKLKLAFDSNKKKEMSDVKEKENSTALTAIITPSPITTPKTVENAPSSSPVTKESKVDQKNSPPLPFTFGFSQTSTIVASTPPKTVTSFETPFLKSNAVLSQSSEQKRTPDGTFSKEIIPASDEPSKTLPSFNFTTSKKESPTSKATGLFTFSATASASKTDPDTKTTKPTGLFAFSATEPKNQDTKAASTPSFGLSSSKSSSVFARLGERLPSESPASQDAFVTNSPAVSKPNVTTAGQENKESLPFGQVPPTTSSTTKTSGFTFNASQSNVVSSTITGVTSTSNIGTVANSSALHTAKATGNIFATSSVNLVTSDGNVFGASTAKAPSRNLFAATTSSTTAGNIFGGTSSFTTAVSGSIFAAFSAPSSSTASGNAVISTTATSESLFASSSAPTSTSAAGNIFGSTLSTKTATGSIFTAPTSTTVAANNFGSTPSSSTTDTRSLFSTSSVPASTTAAASIFESTPSTKTATESLFTTSSAPTSTKVAASIFGSTSSTKTITGSLFTTSSVPASTSAAGNTFGSNPSSTARTSGSLFSGSSAPATNTAASNIFGSTLSSAPTASGGLFTASSAPTSTTAAANVFGSAPSSTATATGSLFSTSSVPAASIFGSTSSSTKTTTGSLFSASPVPTSTTASSNVFGSPPSLVTTATGNIFATSSDSSSSKVSGNMFGSSNFSTTASGSVFGNSSVTTCAGQTLGTNTKTAPGSVFGASLATSSGNVFGISTTTVGNVFGSTCSSTTAGNIFGPSSTVTSATKNVFGTSMTNSTVGSVFGVTPSSTTPTSGNLFGASATVTSTAAGNIFGINSTSTTGFGNVFSASQKAEGVFGNSTAAPPFGNPGSSPAVTSSSLVNGFGVSNPAITSNESAKSSGFGTQSNVSFPPFGTTSNVTFGNVASPSIGSASSTSVFGSGSGTSSFSFGSTTTAPTTSSAFTPPVSTISAFGTSAQTFQNPKTGISNPTFGGSTNTGTLGFGSNLTGGSAFGATSFTAAPTNTFGNNTNAPFTFGAAQNTNSQVHNFGASASSNPSPFQFGGNKNDTSQAKAFGFNNSNGIASNPTAFGDGNNSGGTTPFSFGSASAGGSGQFLFNFGGNAPSSGTGFSFNQAPGTSGLSPFTSPSPGTLPVPGTFSIGSGSTQPRSRALLRHRRKP